MQDGEIFSEIFHIISVQIENYLMDNLFSINIVHYDSLGARNELKWNVEFLDIT